MRRSWTGFLSRPLSSKRLSPSNQADLQHLNRHSIWIASTKQVGIIWIGEGGELLLSANLHTRGELAIQIYSRLILLPKSEAHCSNLRWGDCVKTARRVLGGPSEVRFSVCQSILKRYYWHRLVQYLWARCERSERYLALRDFSNPAGTSNRG